MFTGFTSESDAAVTPMDQNVSVPSWVQDRASCSKTPRGGDPTGTAQQRHSVYCMVAIFKEGDI